MKKEYDFSKGERGKFYHADAVLEIPVYLDADNLSFIQQVARKRGSDISTIVNELLRSDKKLAEILSYS